MSVTSIREILLSNIVYFTDAKANKLNKKQYLLTKRVSIYRNALL